jgi:hypothetical protein
VHSPPKSQEEEDLVMTDAAASSNFLPTENEAFNSKGHPLSPGMADSRSDTNGINDKGTLDSGHGEPGSAWSTKKFAEEYERAFSQLQDKEWSMGAWQPLHHEASIATNFNFSIAQYGDPLLKR